MKRCVPAHKPEGQLAVLSGRVAHLCGDVGSLQHTICDRRFAFYPADFQGDPGNEKVPSGDVPTDDVVFKAGKIGGGLAPGMDGNDGDVTAGDDGRYVAHRFYPAKYGKGCLAQGGDINSSSGQIEADFRIAAVDQQ